VKSLLNRSLGIERESGIDLSRNLSWNNLQDFLSELYQKSIKCSINLLVNVAPLVLSICDSGIDEFGIIWLLGCGENKGRVGGRVLGLVFADRWFLLVLYSGSRF
jgi:hypothetical protein